MIWANFFHCYQPADWDAYILRRVVRESYLPFFHWLVEHPTTQVTINMSAVLTQQLDRGGFTNVLDAVRTVGKRGQVEFVGSAMYHPLLPLVPRAVAERQIAMNAAVNREILGDWFQPRGFFPPEMAVDPSIVPTVRNAGYQWMLVDEIALDGTLGHTPIAQRWHWSGSAFGITFRNRIISDYLFLRADLNNPQEFWSTVAHDRRSDEALVTAMDVENLGHHRPGLDTYWHDLVTDGRVTTMTMSAYTKTLGEAKSCEPRASSWASQEDELKENVPFSLWHNPANAIHEAQWKLTRLVLDLVSHGKHRHDAATDDLVDRALASDGYWWASAEPWWDATIIMRFADRFLAIARRLKISATEHEGVQAAYDAVRAQVRTWESKGTANDRRARFLDQHKTIRRMAGGTLKT